MGVMNISGKALESVIDYLNAEALKRKIPINVETDDVIDGKGYLHFFLN